MTRQIRAIGVVLCALASIWASAAQGQGTSVAQGQGTSGGGASERFVLSGVMLYDGGGLAWLQEPSLTGDRTVALRLSDSIGPYRLTKILGDRVELEGPTGTVLVPVYNAQAPGSTVAATSPGAASPDAAGAPRGRAASPGISPQRAGSPQADPPGTRALRDRLDVARRHVEQLQNAGPVAGQQPGQVKAPEASIGPRGVGGSSSSASSNSQSGSPAAPSSNPAAQSGNTSGQGGASQDVVIAPKGQTFQSILGLK